MPPSALKDSQWTVFLMFHKGFLQEIALSNGKLWFLCILSGFTPTVLHSAPSNPH